VEEREGFSDAEKNRMKLSTETLLGLRITGKYNKYIYEMYVHAVHMTGYWYVWM